MRLDEKTTIPLFGTLLALPVLVGGIFWLTNIDAKSTQALSASEKNEVIVGTQGKVLQEIKESVIRIEEKMKRGGK